MSEGPFILASDDSGIKLIGFVIVAIIWGIGALSSVVKKANEASKGPAAKRQAAIRRPPVSPPPMPVMMARPAPPQMAAKAQIPSRRPQQARAMSAFMPRSQVALPPTMAQRAEALTHMVHTAQVAPRPVAAPMPAPILRAPAAAPDKSVAAASQVTRTTVRSTGATASSIRRWLQPGSLRKQFILTELLQPALALREPRE